MTWHSLAAFLLVAMVALGAPFLVSRRLAEANGVPQLVKLEYLDGVSNWGPEDAEGVLEFSFAEAYARVDVKNLPPQEGYAYEGWMLNDSGAAYFVGGIPVSAAGIGALETALEGLDRYDYNLFIIAGRAAGDAAGLLPSTLSIAGAFMVVADAGEDDPPGDSRPLELPDTGEASPGSSWDRGLFAMAAMTAAGITIMFISRLRRKGDRQ